MNFKLSVLDQSPVRLGGSAGQALHETIELACHVEKLGYTRFWVSEHHSTSGLAGSSPEILLAAIGAATEHIRIGSGGVMLPHYSAHKVAENFAVLSCLYPGRVDLGVGRAPGGQMEVSQALSPHGGAGAHQFPRQVFELQRAFTSADYSPQITPVVDVPPVLWMLGSSPDSAVLAAELGLPYNFALFINSEMSSAIFEIYRDRFEAKWGKGARSENTPYASIAVNVVCADTEEQAVALARYREVLFLKFLKGETKLHPPSLEEVEAYQFSEQELNFVEVRRAMSAVGNPEQVRDKLNQLVSYFKVDEVMVVTITHDFSDRLKSYELLKNIMPDR
ncbi:MAG: LLM class flavin-dependent oxidoreductase [Pseudomonadales bacterium]|nr:LLM class flavin-dependent oxidoreductase [Pseudomonadales bacterium]